jgi:hypothetical protein
MSDEAYITKAAEAWRRVLNMDGVGPQWIAAALWASVYAGKLLKIAAAQAKEAA